MNLNKWESVLVDWVNCLKISKPIKQLDQLKDGLFFTALLHLLNPDDVNTGETSFSFVLNLLKGEYHHIDFGTSNVFIQLERTELISISSLLMHYSCIVDRRDGLTSPLCQRLGKNAQVCIKKFLEKIDNTVTNQELLDIISDCVSKDDIFATRNMTLIESPVSCRSPLQEFLKTPIIKISRLQEKERQITRLNSELETERFEKVYLQDELKLSQERNEKLNERIVEKNLLISKLRSELSDLNTNCEPLQYNGDCELQKRLRDEIKTLEEYTSQLTSEQEVLYRQEQSLKKKLEKVETECISWHEKAVSIEKKYEQLSEKYQQQEVDMKNLHGQCNELSGLLEELRMKNLNESCNEPDSVMSYKNKVAGNVSSCEDLACVVIEVQLKEVQDENANLKTLLKESEENVSKLNQDVAECKGKLEDTSDECDNLMKQVNNLNQQISSLSKLYENLEETNNVLKNNHNTLTAKYNETSSNLKEINEELEKLDMTIEDNLKKLLQFLATDANEQVLLRDKNQVFEYILTRLHESKEADRSQILLLTNRIEGLNVTVDESNKNIVNLQEDLQLGLKERNNLDITIKELQTKLYNEAETIMQLNQYIAENANVIDDLLKKLEQADQEREEKLAQIKSLEEKCCDYRDKQNTMKEELELVANSKIKLETELVHLEKSYKDSITRCEELQVKLNNLEEHKAKIEAENKDYQIGISNLKEELHQEQTNKTVIKDELDTLSERYKDVENRLKEALEEIEKLKQQLDENNEEFSKEKIESSKLLDSINKEAENCKQQIELLENNLLESQEMIKNEISLKENLQLELKESNGEVLNMKTLFSDLESKLSYAEDKNERLLKEFKEKSEEYEDVNEKYGKMSKFVNELQELLKNHQETIQEKEHQVTQLNESLGNLMQEKHDSEVRISNLINELSGKERRIEQLRSNESQFESEIEESSWIIECQQTRIEALEEMSREIENEKKTLLTRNNELESNNQKINEDLDEKINELQTLFKRKEDCELLIGTLKQDIKNGQKELAKVTASYENSITNSKEEINVFNTKISDLEKTIQEFTLNQAESDAVLSEAKSHLEDVTEKYNEILLIKQELENENAESKVQISNLIEDLHNLLEKYNTLDKVHSETMNELENCRQDLLNNNNTIEELNKEITDKITKESEIEKHLSNNTEKIVNLESVLEECKSKMDKQETDMDNLKTQLQIVEEEKLNLSKQLEEAKKNRDALIEAQTKIFQQTEDNLMHAHQSAIDVKNDLMKRIESIDREKEDEKTMRTALEKQCEENRIVIEHSQKELHELKDKLETLAKMFEVDAKEQVDEIIDVLKSKTEELLQEKNQLLARNSALENEKTQVQTNLDAVLAQSQQLSQEKDLLLDNYTTVHVEIGERDKEIEALKEEKGEFESKLLKAEYAIETLQKKLVEHELKNEKIQETYTKISICRSTLEKLITERNSLESLFNNTKQNLSILSTIEEKDGRENKLLIEEKDSLETIAEDVQKQIARISKQVFDTIFTLIEIPNVKTDLENLQFDEVLEKVSDCKERVSELSDRVKLFENNLNIASKRDKRIQKENVLKSSNSNNLDPKEDLKKKNIQLKQRLTLCESAKMSLEKKLKQLREENKALKEVSENIDHDIHYKTLLQQYVQLKDDHEKLINENELKFKTLRDEFDQYKSSRRKSLTSPAVLATKTIKSENETKLETDVLKLREAYGNLMSDNSKLELEIATMRKLLQDRTKQLAEMAMIKQAYENLLEENNRLLLELDTVKYKRGRDREELAKETKSLQEVRNEYEMKLEKMKQKMVQLYREEIDKEVLKFKNEQRENNNLRELIQQLKEDLKHANEMKRLAKELQNQKSDSFFLVPAAKKERFVAERPSLETRSTTSLQKPQHVLEERRASTMPRSMSVINEDLIYKSRKDSVSSVGSDLHMEDEGDLFNNKYLADLKEGRCTLASGKESNASRLSELQWRNSLCPPHLKSSYPAETQFNNPNQFKEDDLKTGNVELDDSMSTRLLPGEKLRKNAGTTSYKRPGPPTPSKNAGRLSLQGNEVCPRDVKEQPETKTPKKSTPSRIKALFTTRNSSSRMSTSENGTPKSKRLSFLRWQK